MLHARCLEVALRGADEETVQKEYQWFEGKPEQYLALALEAQAADAGGKRGEARDLYHRAAAIALRRELPNVAEAFEQTDALVAAALGDVRRLAAPCIPRSPWLCAEIRPLQIA